ncbi:MAG: DUF1214 domain-containing protein [Roseitalea sp.]|jgi:hypothetical protein|nr:DUF1214 domain-containing protein [Roseitalea sp.]MBO6720517.1 DUF1214 domain-containing protein [Roseitalea sp.]MBO6743664.1 DUF1214 domain-containing protein [Roseitalea sp.]
MIRSILTIAYVLGLAFALGGLSAWTVTDRFPGFSALSIGQWTGFPLAGSQNADPYARAHAARNGGIALGAAEGVAFGASRDSDGEPISGTCSYVIEGRLPSSRLWTLRMIDQNGRTLDAPAGRSARTHSRAIVHDAEEGVRIAVSETPEPGNWLHLDHRGPARFILTLYDTSITTSTGLIDFAMPDIRQVGCRS